MGTITKALDLLNVFSRSNPELGLGDVVRLTGRDKATVHRHLVELQQNGFLEQHPKTRAYRLGPALLRLSGVREATHPFRQLIRPVVTQLADQVGELAHASLLQGTRLSPAFHADPERHGTRVRFDEAEMLPLHATSSGLAVLAFADVVIDPQQRMVTKAGCQVRLTHLEYELLRFFADHPNVVFSRNDLFARVWGQSAGSVRTVDNFVGQLRKHFEATPEQPVHFITVRGSGYRFSP
ncbi:MAG: helix-turn-helix domain-containing protein [Rhizobiales bacterium]|nr:helix-turn-helix domain-containing protein [Hyphomicrobiales bacterium]